LTYQSGSNKQEPVA